MEIYLKISFISLFSFFSGFQTRFYRMAWFCPYRSFKYSKWWRHTFCHT